MSRAIADLLQTLSLFVPMKVLVGGLVVVSVIALPWWIESVRDRQIRGLVRRMVRAEPKARDALDRRVLELCGARANRLRTLVEAATRYDQRALRDRALELLERAGAAEDARRFRAAATTQRRTSARDPMEALIRVETMLADGRTVAAAEALADARSAFPGDPDLEALAERLARESDPAG